MEFNDVTIVIKRRNNRKVEKRHIPVYIDPDVVREIDELSKISGHSRNELINTFIEFGLRQVRVEED
jgi:metal-responsive CopG/Arc/MetJ family transcriptional regulator